MKQECQVIKSHRFALLLMRRFNADGHETAGERHSRKTGSRRGSEEAAGGRETIELGHA